LLTSSINAKDIYVKYRGYVNVGNGYFEEIPLKSSSLIKQMFYDKKNSYLLVRLKKTFYHYCSIPTYTILSWTQSKSLGQYYNYSIKGNYDCRVYPQPNY
jgi:hypothetical protein